MSLVLATGMIALIYFGNASMFRPMRLDRHAKRLRVGLRGDPAEVYVLGQL